MRRKGTRLPRYWMLYLRPGGESQVVFFRTAASAIRNTRKRLSVGYQLLHMSRAVNEFDNYVMKRRHQLTDL